MDDAGPADPNAAPRNPLIDLIDEAMERISEDDRDVLRSQYWHEQSYQEIADAYGVTVHVVKDRLRKAKDNLKEAIEQIRREEDDDNGKAC